MKQVNVDNELVNGLKEQYGEIHIIEVGGKVGYFKNPNSVTWGKLIDLYIEGKTFEGDSELAKDCFVGGDKELIDFENSVDYLLSYRELLGALLKVFECKLISKDENAITFECDGMKATIKMPAFKDFKVIMTYRDAGRYFEADKLLVRSGWVEGDEKLKNTLMFPEYLANYRGLLSNLVSYKVASIKKN